MSVTYDRMPYQSRAVQLSHPEGLAVQARLAGYPAVDPRRARILEIGCAEGGNLVPIAYPLQDAELVGIDQSAVHIERAQIARDKLGLDNLRFVHADVRELPDDLGTFDYILCHGVLSWVDEDAEVAIFQAFRDHLTDHGLAYVSYNCEPGWAMRGQLRKVLMARTQGFDDPAEQLRHVRGLLQLMANTPFTEMPYGAYMAEEAADALGHRDEYLVHEYLSPANRAFRYGQIVGRASENGLRFLAELCPVGHRGIEDRVHEVVAGITEDPVEREELADVLFGRGFRASLFTREAVRPGDADEAAAALCREAWFVGLLNPKSKRPSLEPGDAEPFEAPEGIEISVSHPILKAALMEITRAYPRGVTLAELEARVTALLTLRRVHPVGWLPSDEERESLRGDLLRLVHLRHLSLRLIQPDVAVAAGATPRASTLTRFEARNGAYVTDSFHYSIYLDDAARYLIALLDGTLDRDTLAAKLLETLQEHEVEVRDEAGASLEGEGALRAMRLFVDRNLDSFALNGLLEARTPEG